MKKLLLFTFVLGGFFTSCTWEDNRTDDLPGNPNCVFCDGDGYIKKTSLFIFNTYNDCHCKKLYQLMKNGNNITFRGKGGNGEATPPNASSDGYIYQGYSINYKRHSYKLYKNSGYRYIYDKKDGWICID